MRISDWSSDVCSSDLIVPADVQAKFRDIARRLVTGFCLSPTPTTAPDSGMVEKLREIKDAARYVPVGDGFFDPYDSNIEAVDAAVDRALSALQPDRKSTRLNSSH